MLVRKSLGPLSILGSRWVDGKDPRESHGLQKWVGQRQSGGSIASRVMEKQTLQHRFWVKETEEEIKAWLLPMPFPKTRSS